MEAAGFLLSYQLKIELSVEFVSRKITEVLVN